MWDRLRTTSSSPSMFTGQEQVLKGRGVGGGVQKRSMAQKYYMRVARPGRTPCLEFEDDSFLDSLDIMAISNSANGPNRYAIQQGRVVPRHQNVDIILPSQDGFESAHPGLLPPRRSSRRRQRQQAPALFQSNSAWRPASSIYDNSDGETSAHIPQYKLESSTKFGGSTADQISPPTSPEVDAVRDGFAAGEVSPIDDDFDLAQRMPFRGTRDATTGLPSQQQRADLPAPHRGEHRSDGSVATQPQVLQSTGRKWNNQVHTGRILNPSGSDASRHDAQRRPVPTSGRNTPAMSPENMDIQHQSPPHMHNPRLMRKAKPESLDSRPPWNGASGRSALVEPVHDDTNVAPLTIPRKSSKRPGRSGKPLVAAIGAGISGSGSAGSSMRKFLPLVSKHKTKKSTSLSTQLPPEGPLQTAARSYPSPPHTDFPVSERTTRDEPLTDRRTQPLASHPPEPPSTSVNAIKRKPPPLSAQTNAASNYPAANAKSSDGMGALPVPVSSSPVRADDAWVQPPSRFSITTYATSNPGTPRHSAEEKPPPLPTMPQVTSIVGRSRPIPSDRSRPSSSEEPVVISISSPYAPVEASSQNRPGGAHPRSKHQEVTSDLKSPGRRASSLSMSKPLPPAPPEMQVAQDPVSQLNTQLNGLIHRRANIEKSIKQMTELMPQDNLLASDQVLRKREEEKQKVEGLRQELAEIQREEHDLGLKLFRAYKRQDKDTEYEPTTLWVRRVAG